MGRYDRKHSADHKAAVIAAFETQGMTAPQVVALAAAGELKAPGSRNRLAPFTIAESTVKTYAHHARRRSRRATTNGALEAHEQAPAETTPPRQEDPEPDEDDSSFMRMLMHGDEHDQAIAAGRTCCCTAPEPSEYAYTPAAEQPHDIRVCHTCFAPITGRPHASPQTPPSPIPARQPGKRRQGPARLTPPATE